MDFAPDTFQVIVTKLSDVFPPAVMMPPDETTQ